MCVFMRKSQKKKFKDSKKFHEKKTIVWLCVCVHGFCHHFFNHRHWSGHWVQNFVFFISISIIWLWFFSIHESNVIIIFLNEWILLDLSSLFIIHKTKNTHTHKCWNNVSLMKMKTTLWLAEIKSDLKPRKWCWNNGI